MGPTVDLADPLAGQVRVELGRGDTRMSEQLLDDPQVGAALEQVRRERVAQRVRADAVRETGRRGPPTSPPPRPAAARAGGRGRRGTPGPPRVGATWCRARRRSRGAGHPARQPVERDVADRHEPLLVALADDADEPAVDREVLGVEAERLADPQPGGVEQLEQGPVAELPVGSGASGSSPPAASSRRSVSSTVSVSGRSRVCLGRSRWAATSLSIRPSP